MRLMLYPVMLVCLSLVGCMPNESGRVAAQNTGDLLAEPAPRHAEVPQRCGEVATVHPALLRRPYLQAVSAEGGSIVWTSTSEAEVVLRTLDGEPVDRQPGVMEETTYLSEGRQYVATFDGLTPSTTYCYSLTDGERTLIGPHELRTAPDAGGEERVDIVVFGDSGGATEDQLALADQMGTVPSDLMLHTGDIAYGRGTLGQFEEGYFEVYETLLRRTPMFPTSGNHDYGTDSAGPYREVFVLPGEPSPAGPERYYSFDWGPVHVVALDSERDGSEQAEWLRQDLAANDRPWTLVTAHKGPYSSGAHGPNRRFRELYQPILEEHGVQLVLTGHDHHYERTEPVGGVTYVVTGGGGWSTRAPAPDGEHSVFAEGVVHFVYVSIEGAALRVHAIDATGREFDGVEIVHPTLGASTADGPLAP